MIGRYLQAMAVLVLVSATSEAQQFQIQPGSAGYNREDLPSAADIDVSIDLNMEVRDFDFDMKDQPELYDIDQWSETDPQNAMPGTFDKLVYVYEVPLPWDPTMIDRVAEAKVVDEEAIFPIPASRYRFCRGPRLTAKRRRESYAFAPIATSPSQSSRYSDLPQGEEPFVILDLAGSEHLGMVPGSWRP